MDDDKELIDIKQQARAKLGPYAAVARICVWGGKTLTKPRYWVGIPFHGEPLLAAIKRDGHHASWEEALASAKVKS